MGMGCKRRGMALAFVLGAAMLVLVIGLGALHAVRTDLRTARAGGEAGEARSCARSIIELGLLRIREEPEWRSTLGEAKWISNQPIGRGVASLTATRVPDADADPLNDDWVLTGECLCGGAVRKIDVTLTRGIVLGEWRHRVD